MPHSILPVLLVEDNPGDVRLIRDMLARSGDIRFELTDVPRLEAALDLLRERRFAVVLLDLSLPDSHGLETFRALRTEMGAEQVRLPVVVLTGMDDTEMALQAVQEGAEDYLVKGDVTAARLVHALRYAIGRHRRHVARDHALESNEEELRIARRIQQPLFPRQAPVVPGFDIGGASFPAVLTGGDFFDYLPLGANGLGLVIGDVSGHGVGPALLMAATRAVLRAFARTTQDIGEILARTNELLTPDLVPDSRYVTLLLARLDPRTRTLQHTSASHRAGYVFDRSGTVREELLCTDLAVGWEGPGPFTTAPKVQLTPGDLVLFLTDGILEAKAPTGEPFGIERTLAYVRRHRIAGSKAIGFEHYRQAVLPDIGQAFL
jgi:serine phosphatase RsbU (regulator of sigma subunit)